MEENSFQFEQTKNRAELWNLSVRDLFFKYIRFIPLFVVSVAIALMGAWVYLRYTVPTYSSTGSMIIKGGDSKSSAKDDKVDELFGTNRSQNIQNEIEILKSKPLMKRVVEKYGLHFSYYAIGKIKTVNVYKTGPFIVNGIVKDSSAGFSFKVKFLNDNEFRVDGNNAVYRMGQEFNTPYGVFYLKKNGSGAGSNSYNVVWQTAEQAAAMYANALKVMPKAVGTAILLVSMQSPNPVLAADVINGVMEEYGLYSVEQKKQSSDQILNFVNERMLDNSRKLDSVQRLYLDFQTRNRLIDAEAQTDKYFEVIGETDKNILVQSEILNNAQYVDEYLADKKNAFSKVVVPSALGLADNTLVEFVTAYNTAQMERKKLIDANVPPNHPMVLEMDGQIEKSRLNIRESLRNLQNVARESINKNKQRGGVGEQQLSAMPEKVKEMVEIKRLVELYQGLDKLFTEKKENTAISRASTVSNSEIIEKAGVSNNPVSPKKRTIQAIALLLGLLIPAIFIFLNEVLNDKITTRFDIEKITPVPIIGEVGHSFSENTLIATKTNRSMVSEQFRIIRSNLKYVLHGKEKAVVLTTSSFSGEGKSFISTNVAAVLALAGKKTVVLEFDIRKPKLISGLGMTKSQGISNFLVGKESNPNELIRPVPDNPNLFVMGCGPVPPNPSELLLDPLMDKLFTWLKEHFDMVVIDTAPIGMVSDAMTLGKYADATLYVVRQGYTFKKQVALIDEFYKEQKLPKISVIINDVKVKPGYGYYGYGRYGYGYGHGYGSYYEEEVPPNGILDRIINFLDFRRFFPKNKKK